VNDPAAKTGDGGTQNQALPKEIQARLKEIFAWLQKDARDQIRDVDHFEEMLEPISQKLPEDVKASLEPISGLDPLCGNKASPEESIYPTSEDHVWFEDRWTVASLCDE
jgi:hypothetical protein